jgi:hypothetical protein
MPYEKLMNTFTSDTRHRALLENTEQFIQAGRILWNSTCLANLLTAFALSGGVPRCSPALRRQS